MKSFLACIVLLVAIEVSTARSLMAQTAYQRQDSTSQLFFQPVFDRPIDPNLYLVRPGDKLLVTFLQTNLPELQLSVSSEGYIINPGIGVIDISGSTLAQVRQRLKQPLALQFSAKDVSITITEPRQVTVAVTGAVNKPGHYRIYNSSTVSEVIEMAGGVAPGGSTRNILFLGGAKPIDVDLDRAQLLGDDSANPYLYAGFRVVVPVKSDRVVQVIGEVQAPREIELKAGDSLETLIALAGGFTRNANIKAAHVLRAPDRDPHVSANIQAGDVIEIPSLAAGTTPMVAIFGEVNAPGRYSFAESMSIEQLVQSAGGLTKDGNAARTTIFRIAESDSWQTATQDRYPMEASLNPGPGTLTLHPFDSVYVPRKVGWVRVSGLVRAPGLVPYVDGKDALFYIKAAGGMVAGADSKEVLVFNRVSRVGLAAPATTAVRDGDEVTVQALEQLP